ncbi:MAG TPA: Gfo/Idh/MocA family oxidoreductase [Gammaproteobacteria bacterium]|nr:Gfo/Idh/MocA family oxidoreductase [Gammaproteobacteria bacterium]
MRALVVGLGSIGIRHLNNLKALSVEDLSVCRRRNLPLHTDVDLDGITVFLDYQQALQSRPDIVVVSNPTSMHAKYARLALDMGADIYLEKPVSHDVMNIPDIQAAAQKHGSICAIGCQLRFDPTLEAVKQWLNTDRIGKLLTVSCDSGEYLPDWHPWEDYRNSYAARSDLGGGVILTVIHEFDYLYWLFGPIERVYAEGGALTSLAMDVEDTVMALFKTRRGVPIHLRLDYWRKPSVRCLNIVGEDGEINWDYYQGKATIVDRSGNITDSVERNDSWDRNDMFIAAMRDFLDAIRTRKNPRTPLQEGIDVLRIAMATRDSIELSSSVSLDSITAE